VIFHIHSFIVLAVALMWREGKSSLSPYANYVRKKKGPDQRSMHVAC